MEVVDVQFSLLIWDKTPPEDFDFLKFFERANSQAPMSEQ